MTRMTTTDTDFTADGDCLDLFEKAVEGRLRDGECERLERLVLEDESIRRRYVAFAQVHAALAACGAALPQILDEPHDAGRVPAFAAAAARPRIRYHFATLATAAALAFAFTALLFRAGAPTPVAVLIEAAGCRWAGSELPTVEGSSLQPGTLDLVEGIATVAFTSGAVLSLEAPVSVEVVSAMKCRLVAGSLLAEVPESAQGFVIETPDMQVIDHGTRFGVTSNELGQSQVFVIEGLVEVDSESVSAEPRMLRTGESIRFEIKDAAPEQEPSRGPAAAIQDPAGSGWTVIATSTGRGKDSFVRHDASPTPHGREPLVLVKHTDLARGNQRKGYFGFDLSALGPLGDGAIAEAQFALDVEHSGLGFLAMVPDSRFAVYGLTDESADGWDESSLVWENAPANTGSGDSLDPDKVTKVGEFEILRGSGGGPRTISGDALVDFLNADTNGIATLIVVRETGETDKMGLVHAFASREHPSARPPALRLKMR